MNRMNTVNKRPGFIFETSWEVCNKVGGIHTVISTKSPALSNAVEAKIIYIGPDNAHHSSGMSEFKEDKNLYLTWVSHARRQGLKVRM